MFCPKCGSEVPSGGVFCASCGAPLKNNEGACRVQVANPSAGNRSPRKKAPLFIGGGVAAVAIIVVVVVVYSLFFAPYPIDENRFPDAMQRAALSLSVDTDGDGAISRDEAAAVEGLTISGASSVQGLDIFPNLARLKLEGAALSSVILDDCSALVTLDANGCSNLRTLSLNGANALASVTVVDAPIETLDLEGKSNLTVLECEDEVALEHLDATPLHEYWLMDSYTVDDSASGNFHNVSATYDARGNLTTLVDETARYGTDTYQYEYDENERCIGMKTSYSGSSNTDNMQISYNDKSLPSKTVATYGYGEVTTTDYLYNDDGLPKEVTTTPSSGSGTSWYFTYDSNGLLTEAMQAGHSGDMETITNDAAGRIVQIDVIGYGNPVYKMEYSDAGLLTSISMSGENSPFRSTFEYDAEGRFIDATNTNDMVEGPAPKYQTGDISSTAFEYDSHGLLTKVKPNLTGNGTVIEYSIGYKRVLTTRENVPNICFVDFGNVLEPRINADYWDIANYVYSYSLPYQGSMKNIMAKAAPGVASAL